MRLFPLALALLAMAVTSLAQTVTISEPFTGTSLSSGWVVGGSGYTPILTAPGIDTAGNGWLRLTSSGTNQATYAVNTNSFASANATISVAFDYAAYNGTGADGITFFLADASKTFSVGAYGGSLGYAQKTAAGGATDINGMSGGYIGVGIDEFGNFSNPTEGRVGGVGSTPNAIAVRGPGDGLTGYDYLGGTSNLGANSIAFSASGTRPTGADTRSIGVTISATNQMVVYLSMGGGAFVPLYEIDLSGYTRPDSLILGFTGSTGGSTNIHEVRNVALTSVTASLWTTNGGDGLWGTGTNWVGDTVPPAYTDVLLDNTFASSAQAIDLGGGTRTVRGLLVDAPFSYTLNNGTLAFDANGVIGPSGIFVSSTHGNADQTINANITTANAIEIKNDSTGQLALTGTLANGGNLVTLTGSGDTTVSGVISGTGGISKIGTGETTLSAANTYSGGTTISAGTLLANNNSALGTGTVVLSGGTLGSTSGASVANAISLTGNAGLSGITTTGTMTQTGGSRTLTLDNATVAGTLALSDSNAARTLTTSVNSGTSTISGAITNGGTGAGSLTKTGAGTLTLSGDNTFSGTMTISGGTVQLGASDRLADNMDLSIASGGAFSLNGYSERVDVLTADGGSTVDFGSTSGANNFLFGTYNAPASGVMVVNNWESGLDNLATTVNGQTVNSIYFSGYGVADYSGTTTLYGVTSYLLAPVAVTEKEWDGSSSTTWGTNANWTAPNAPTATQVALFDALGVARANAIVGNNTSVAGIRFGSGATVGYNISGSNGTRTLTLTGAVPYIQQQSSQTQTISIGRLALGASTVADITGSGDLAISSSIQGAFSLIKDGTGSGKLLLSGANTFSGGLYVNNGAVTISNSSAMGTGAASVASGAALEVTGGISPTNALTLNGTGLSNGGALRNISGSNTLSGAITLGSNTRINSDAGTMTLTGGLSGARGLTMGGAGNITVASAIATGTGGVTVDGTGTVTFSGATSNTYTGATTVNSGALNLSKSGGAIAVGSGGLVVNGGSVTETSSNQISTSATVTVNSGSLNLAAGASQTLANLQTATGSTVSVGSGSTLTVNGTGASNVAGTISGAGAVALSGTGTTYLLGSNTYSGGTTASSSVRVNNSSSLGTGAVTVNSGGNIQLQNNVNVANNFTLSGTGTSAQNGAIENFAGANTVSGNITLAGAASVQSSTGTLTLAGNITGAAELTFGGAGNTVVSGSLNNGSSGVTKTGSGDLTFTGSSTFGGSLNINGGSVSLGSSNALSDSLAISIASGASFELLGRTETIGSIGGSGVLDFGSAGTGALSLTSTSSFSGNIVGDGLLTLGSGSSLLLSSSINNASLDIALSGGTLTLSNSPISIGKLTITENSIIDFGGSSTFSLANLEILPGVTLTIQNWADLADYFYAQNFEGAAFDTRGSAPTNQIVFTGWTGDNTRWQSFDNQITPVPEPSTYGAVMIGLAAGFLGWRRMRRRK